MLALQVVVALLLTFLGVDAQQLPGYFVSYDELGLSSACFNAVNATVTACPAWLLPFAGFEETSFNLLASTELDDLCGTTCQADLTSLKANVAAACTQETDIMVPNGIAYPASLIVDRLLYAVGLSCLKDSASGSYCDLIVAGWMNQTGPYSKAQNCSQCQLEIQAKQLGSPFGYDSDAASSYASSTSSCAVTKYTYTTPTSYALNSTTTPPARPTCSTDKTYVIKEDDSCNSIAESQGVSTGSLISINGLDMGCDSMPSVGTALCLPPTCRIRELAVEDTCDSIITAENITLSQLLAWNPVISPGCNNLNSWRGRFICASSPQGTITVPDGDSATTEAPIPTNTQGESNTHCGQWYTIKPDDTCASISVAFSLQLVDFYFLNLGVDNSTCNNLWLGYAYCVKAVGNIQTYPGYPVEVPSTSFTRPPEPTETPPPVFDFPSLNARAPGTVNDCDDYENAWPKNITSQNPDANSCESWANMADVMITQLRRWNPSLTEDNCVFLEQYSYCVLKESDMDDPLPTAPPPTPTSTPPPAETQPGTIENCQKWHVVADGDGCWSIANQYGISLDDFYKWNPGVGSNCETLWFGYAVCVGV